MDATKPTVESSRLGRGAKNSYFARTVSAPAVFQQMLGYKVKQDINILLDGLTNQEAHTHFNNLVDLINVNPWTHSCVGDIDWDNLKIVFTNGIEVIYK